VTASRRAAPCIAWLLVAALYALGAGAGSFAPHEAIDWQPGLALSQPWRAFSAIGVHYSGAHLAGNLAGIALAVLAIGIWVAGNLVPHNHWRGFTRSKD